MFCSIKLLKHEYIDNVNIKNIERAYYCYTLNMFAKDISINLLLYSTSLFVIG